MDLDPLHMPKLEIRNGNSVIEVTRRSRNDKGCVILNAVVLRSSLVL